MFDITVTAQTNHAEPPFSTYITRFGIIETDRFVPKPRVEVMPLGWH